MLRLVFMYGRGFDGAAYAAACRAAAAKPLNAAAQNAHGLATEARGDFTVAQAAYSAAAQLLQSSSRGVLQQIASFAFLLR